jgi:hypothetical protein
MISVIRVKEYNHKHFHFSYSRMAHWLSTPLTLHAEADNWYILHSTKMICCSHQTAFGVSLEKGSSCETWGFHGAEDSIRRLLGSDAVYSVVWYQPGRSPWRRKKQDPTKRWYATTTQKNSTWKDLVASLNPIYWTDFIPRELVMCRHNHNLPPANSMPGSLAYSCYISNIVYRCHIYGMKRTFGVVLG